MTAEVAVLNRSAVALAADSAVTVEGFSKGQQTTKVFNTANKLFTLSKYAPIGVMFYNTMTLGGVPWEVIIKEYRRNLGKRRFATLRAYADDFFIFLRGNTRLFPEDEQKNVIVTILTRAFTPTFFELQDQEAIRDALEAKCNDLEPVASIEHFPEQLRDQLKRQYKEQIKIAAKLAADPVNIEGLEDLCGQYASLVLTRVTPLEGYSGLVFAGFGEDEIYPNMIEYVVDGIVDSNVRYVHKEHWRTSYNKQSHVVPFAERDSVRTILDGVHSVYGRKFVVEAIRMISGVVDMILQNITELTNEQREIYRSSSLSSVVDAFRLFTDEMTAHRQVDYSDPIRQAIAVMPLSELAVVAEVFVNIAQIRQRMSLDTETVGGPVDVAVISKGDGFVWIKRKHYFDSKINPFFLERYLQEDILASGRHGEGRGHDDEGA